MRVECWVSAPKQNHLGRGLAISPDNTHFFTDANYDFSVGYSPSGLEFISLNKNYIENGEAVAESSKLLVNSVSSSFENGITSRDYFEGK